VVQLIGGAFLEAGLEGATLAGRFSAIWADGDLPLQCAAAVAYFYLPAAWAVAGLVARAVRGNVASTSVARPAAQAVS
jgi:hypothetical protein